MAAATPVIVKGTPVATTPGTGAWGSTAFGCTADWCSCLAVACCSPVTTAQLFTRFFSASVPSVPPSVLCLCITIFLFVAMSCNAPAQTSTTTTVYTEDGMAVTIPGAPVAVSPVVGMIGFLGTAASQDEAASLAAQIICFAPSTN